MYNTCIRVSLIITAFLIILFFFARYVKEVSVEMQGKTDIMNMSYSVKPITDTGLPLGAIQQKILGYKEVELKVWTADMPKPPRAIFSTISETSTDEVECLDKECRWTQIVGPER